MSILSDNEKELTCPDCNTVVNPPSVVFACQGCGVTLFKTMIPFGFISTKKGIAASAIKPKENWKRVYKKDKDA